MQRLFAWFVGSSAAAMALPAQAAPRLVYQGATGCPGRAEFVAAVRARGGNVELAGDASDEIDVVIERAGGDYRGTARVQSAGQSSEAREVRSTVCAEVADGLAIVTALASQTGVLPDPPPTATPAPTSEAAAPKSTTIKAPPPSKAATEASTRLHTLGQFRDETLRVTEGELRVRNDLALTLSGGALFGVIPSTVIPRVDLTLARTNFITTPDGAGHVIGGILRSRWTLLAPSTYRDGDWSTQFFGFKASLGGCSQLAYDLTGFVLLACGELGVGFAKVRVKDPSGHTTSDELVGLGTAALDLDARYNLGRLFHVGLTLGGEGWVNPVRAHASDGHEVFHTRQLGAYAFAGVGMHFW